MEPTNNEKDVLNDINYICKSCSFITEALQRGADIVQMSNGDIFVTEVRPRMYTYVWNSAKGKLVRQISRKVGREYVEQEEAFEEA